jgi:hypothetical protein
MLGQDVPQSPGPFGDKCLFDKWPGIPLHIIAGRDDRFFPVELPPRSPGTCEPGGPGAAARGMLNIQHPQAASLSVAVRHIPAAIFGC